MQVTYGGGPLETAPDSIDVARLRNDPGSVVSAKRWIPKLLERLTAPDFLMTVSGTASLFAMSSSINAPWLRWRRSVDTGGGFVGRR